MIVIKQIADLITNYSEDKIDLTIGNFDGVHLGHREFLARINNFCKLKKSKFVVVTFVPHPVQVLKGHSAFLLNTYAERRELLAQCGVDYLLEIDFTRDFSSLSPEDFFKKYIFEFKGIETIYLGHDFLFGANKAGNFNVAKKLCENKKVELVLQEEFKIESESISSSTVRAHVADGDMEKANLLLGRPYFISGRVIRGQGRGRQIGYPTANLDYDRELILPAKGVYITQTRFKDMVYNSITNIGINPTFNMGDVINIETNLFDFDRDIYGEEMRVIFLKKLRDEKKFVSVNDLIAQINQDVMKAKEHFKK